MYVAKSNSWIVVIGAVNECPKFEYRILDAQYLRNRDTVQLAGASMIDLIGLSEKEIRSELQDRDDLSAEIIPDSLKVLVYKAALPPEVIKRIIVQESRTVASDCQHNQRRKGRLPGFYEGDGPHDISIDAVKAVA
jgi:hypothetical protein